MKWSYELCRLLSFCHLGLTEQWGYYPSQEGSDLLIKGWGILPVHTAVSPWELSNGDIHRLQIDLHCRGQHVIPIPISSPAGLLRNSTYSLLSFSPLLFSSWFPFCLYICWLFDKIYLYQAYGFIKALFIFQLFQEAYLNYINWL